MFNQFGAVQDSLILEECLVGEMCAASGLINHMWKEIMQITHFLFVFNKCCEVWTCWAWWHKHVSIKPSFLWPLLSFGQCWNKASFWLVKYEVSYWLRWTRFSICLFNIRLPHLRQPSTRLMPNYRFDKSQKWTKPENHDKLHRCVAVCHPRKKQSRCETMFSSNNVLL